MSIFVFNDTATTEIYTLSLHDALPISQPVPTDHVRHLEVDASGKGGMVLDARSHVLQIDRPHRLVGEVDCVGVAHRDAGDRKSTRLNSSHANISYAVFCLKKKPILNSI